jgi:alcohol dehydrogenase
MNRHEARQPKHGGYPNESDHGLSVISFAISLIVGPFDFSLRTRVVFGDGAFARLGELARELSFTRALLVADRGIVATGQVERAAALLDAQGVRPFAFHDFDANPDSRMVDAGRAVAASCRVDSIVAVGGGSSLDCAKGINFVLTNGGTMRDYRGFGQATRPMLPSIGVPTTAGTGSEAQSYALISDSETHAKMACGDPKAAFRVAILDPALTLTQPREVTAIAGYDAISHAVESYVTTRRSDASDLFARDAWRWLSGNFARVLEAPDDQLARSAMLWGAHEAGIAIEQSMLGATHACANPLTARYGTAHGIAIAVMLPHVVRWNAEHVGDRYAELLVDRGAESPALLKPEAAGEQLAARLEELRRAGHLPATLREIGVPSEDFQALATDAATQWTGTCNPRTFDAASALELYQRAY